MHEILHLHLQHNANDIWHCEVNTSEAAPPVCGSDNQVLRTKLDPLCPVVLLTTAVMRQRAENGQVPGFE